MIYVRREHIRDPLAIDPIDDEKVARRFFPGRSSTMRRCSRMLHAHDRWNYLDDEVHTPGSGARACGYTR
ncbi:MAG TPA: hypothetical protein VFP84_16245 [Kofleriaceae bacterium]|nr:hypothetical protein [Kofleriaceae bacterium]